LGASAWIAAYSNLVDSFASTSSTMKMGALSIFRPRRDKISRARG
jgi:hypothetical protein